MKSKAIVSAVIALTLVTGGSAFAQGRDGNDRSEQGQRGGPQDRRDGDNRQQERRQFDRGNNRDNNRNNRDHDQNEQRRDERGAGPNHEFHRGDRLPAEYRNRSYVVNDWHGHNLSAPPRGYQWVQTGGDYVLAAIATGVILQLLLGN